MKKEDKLPLHLYKKKIRVLVDHFSAKRGEYEVTGIDWDREGCGRRAIVEVRGSFNGGRYTNDWFYLDEIEVLK